METKTIRVPETGQELAATLWPLEAAEKPFQIAVDADSPDEITKAILAGSFHLPSHSLLLRDLVPPGSRVLDVGAHIGTFSLFAASLGYQVVAVEASPVNAALLLESVRANGFSHVRVIHAAASDRAGELDFLPAGPYGHVTRRAAPGTLPVRAAAIDDLLDATGWDTIDFIKMDVEGSELAALRGMRRRLGRGSPPIVYESNGHTLNFLGETPNSLLALLESFGYRSYLIGGPGQLFARHSATLQPECNVDYLAVKGAPERLGRWQEVSAMPHDEIRRRALSSCRDPHPHLRAYIGRALERAGAGLLQDMEIAQALSDLRNDDDADVRASVRWWRESPGAR